MSPRLSLVYYRAGRTIEGTAPVQPLVSESPGGGLGAVDVTLHSTVPDCRGLDPDVRRAEWLIEVGNRVRDGAMPLVQEETVATFGLSDELARGVQPGEAGLVVSVSVKGFDEGGNEKVQVEEGAIIREAGVYIAAVRDGERAGREDDIQDNPDLFTLHDGILLFRAEPRHLRHRPFPYLVFSAIDH
ncbi:MAG: hypothetical protein ISR64_01445 [Deltaproteobacteria bacterium]|nr:hypothetical protein [Deltaproteobacteria bacterium]